MRAREHEPLASPPFVINPESILSTLDKGLRVLDELALEQGRDGLTLTEIAVRMDMHRTTLFRLLTTLRARGYVTRDPRTDRYRLGVKLLGLSAVLLNQIDVREICRPALIDLRDRTRELIQLTIRDGDDVVTIDRFEGTQPLSLQTDLGTRRPLYCTATGKVFLAFATSTDIERVLALGMPAITRKTITTPAAMYSHLEEIRARGYAIDDEERIPGVRCVAAAVISHDRALAGAISLAAPAQRMPVDRVRKMGEEVAFGALAVSRELGYLG
jgi:DNA-binding IclR family transcriptional regulator